MLLVTPKMTTALPTRAPCSVGVGVEGGLTVGSAGAKAKVPGAAATLLAATGGGDASPPPREAPKTKTGAAGGDGATQGFALAGGLAEVVGSSTSTAGIATQALQRRTAALFFSIVPEKASRGSRFSH